MRWPLKDKVSKSYPSNGAVRYRIRFAWRPVIAKATSGVHGWDRQIIWLEKVMEEQAYRWYLYGGHGWEHDDWMPINEFTLSLYEHNNQ